MSKIKDRVKTLESKDKQTAALSAKRKRAMVEYMAIMFTVAFLLVAVSLFVQNRSLKQDIVGNTNSSMSLRGRIENLQTENRELREKLAVSLLDNAKNALEQDDMTTFAEKMTELEPYSAVLNEELTAEYQQLRQLLPDETVETE